MAVQKGLRWIVGDCTKRNWPRRQEWILMQYITQTPPLQTQKTGFVCSKSHSIRNWRLSSGQESEVKGQQPLVVCPCCQMSPSGAARPWTIKTHFASPWLWLWQLDTHNRSKRQFLECRPVMENRSGLLIILQSHTPKWARQHQFEALSTCTWEFSQTYHSHSCGLAFHPHANGFLAPQNWKKK